MIDGLFLRLPGRFRLFTRFFPRRLFVLRSLLLATGLRFLLFALAAAFFLRLGLVLALAFLTALAITALGFLPLFLLAALRLLLLLLAAAFRLLLLFFLLPLPFFRLLFGRGTAAAFLLRRLPALGLL
ncbi:MAG TPA: hypothetical protein ENK05_02780 [Gammaproteobacteria bacterium]|nr:hypothetical protein [Gammaproteobacteria bacterium]